MNVDDADADPNCRNLIDLVKYRIGCWYSIGH